MLGLLVKNKGLPLELSRAGNESESSVTVTYDPSIETAYEYDHDANGNLEQMVKTALTTR